MTTTPSPQTTPTEGSFYRWIRSLGIVRVTQDRWIGGVASGLARRFGIDPLIVRGIFFISAFFGGIGLVFYALCWAFLPEESDGRIHFQQLFRGDFNAAIIGATVMFFIGTSGTWSWQIFGWNGVAPVFWTLALIAGAVLLFYGLKEANKDKKDSQPTPQMWAQAPAQQPGPTTPMSASTPASGTTPWSSQTTEALPEQTTPMTMPLHETNTEDHTMPIDDTVPIDHTTPIDHTVPMNQTSSIPQEPNPTSTLPPWAQGGSATYTTDPAVNNYQTIQYTKRGPGAAWVGIVIGLCLIATAAMFLVDRVHPLGILLPVAIIGACIVILGLGIVVSGLRGRTSGLLGFLAICGLVVGIPAGAVASVGDFDGVTPMIAADTTWSPLSAADAERGYAAAVGQVNIDLTHTSLPSGTTVPVELTVGQVNLSLPLNDSAERDRNYLVIIERADRVSIDETDTSQLKVSRGPNNRVEYKNYASGTPDVTVTIKMWAGSIVLDDESREFASFTDTTFTVPQGVN